MRPKRDEIAMMLMRRILDLVNESGATVEEAKAALDAAAAFIPMLGLSHMPTEILGN